MLRTLIGATALSVMVGTSARAQPDPRLFAGAVAGIATLSADARSEITTAGADVSLYKPENGPALNVFFGVHLQDYVTVQATYRFPARPRRRRTCVLPRTTQRRAPVSVGRAGCRAPAHE